MMSSTRLRNAQIQDFRFLCPNGTAFDQEAQTCADFGDVNCEQATLYFGSDNFDLYRIGSSFDKKVSSIPAAEEESTFHLQRAESSKYTSFSKWSVAMLVMRFGLFKYQIENLWDR